MEIRLILLRHGLTATNTERRYIGRRSDPPLSEQGKRELQIRREKDCIPRRIFYIPAPCGAVRIPPGCFIPCWCRLPFPRSMKGILASLKGKAMTSSGRTLLPSMDRRRRNGTAAGRRERTGIRRAPGGCPAHHSGECPAHTAAHGGGHHPWRLYSAFFEPYDRRRFLSR